MPQKNSEITYVSSSPDKPLKGRIQIEQDKFDYALKFLKKSLHFEVEDKSAIKTFYGNNSGPYGEIKIITIEGRGNFICIEEFNKRDGLLKLLVDNLKLPNPFRN